MTGVRKENPRHGPARLDNGRMLRALRRTTAALAGLAAAATASADIIVTTEPVAPGVSSPTYLTVAPGDTERLFFSLRSGVIHIVKDGEVLAQPFLDISDRVGSVGVERAFASFTFHPDYETNGFFYVVYSNLDDDSIVSRFTVTADPEVADPASEQVLLTVDQPSMNHNVSWVGFGPDGYLYIACGDGALGGQSEEAQRLTSLFGKMLRVDVDGASPYAIPPSNPFVGRKGLDEIWAYGLRAPWRCSFDRQSGDLWIADVGHADWEEFNMQPAASPGGENYGWPCEEGNNCHEPPGDCVCGNPTLVSPAYEYPHPVGCAVIGGYVYRGSAIPGLAGQYVFGDYCSGKVRAYDCASGDVTELLTNQIAVVSFGEDHDGELYVIGAVGISKIVPADCNGNGVPDSDDIDGGGSQDCNTNGVPDECEPDCNDNMVADECDIDQGTSDDDNGDGIPDECQSGPDLNGDGMVSTADLLLLLAAWGPCPKPPDPCAADFDGDGSVGTADLLTLLGEWG
jgi:glucose/arabinose dehydrogenase